MSQTYDRVWNQARKEQGFKNQDELDAFFAYYDHSKTCPKCQKFGSVRCDDGYQPVQILCDEGERIYSVYARRS